MTMWMVGAVIERTLRFVRESGAPRIAALWALAAFLVAAVLIRRRQDTFGLKLGTSLLAFGGAAGALLWWSFQPTAQYYKFVDEVVAQHHEFRFRRLDLEVHGCVVFESIERRVGSDEYRFRLGSRPERPRAVLEARYTGLVPDTFRAGAEVVVRGTLAADGRLDVVPDGIMARCPSKYDAADDSDGYDGRGVDGRRCGDP